MPSARRLRHLGSLAWRSLWFVGSRQYLSLVSAAVLIVLAGLVLTSDSFESRDVSPEARNRSRNENTSTASFAPRPARLSVLFYVVNDEAQRDDIAGALHSDRSAFDAGVAPTDYVIYLIAGTKEEEARAIARLNFEETAARAGNVDMRVIDLRGRFD